MDKIQNVYQSYLGVQFAIPRTSALLLAGAGFYVSCIDPCVRDNYQNIRANLKHWSSVAKVAQTPMNILAALTGILGLNAYRLSKEPLWAWGSLTVLSIIPISLFLHRKLEKSLHDQNQKAGSTIQIAKGQLIISKMFSWLWRQKLQALLALGSAVLFYLAQDKVIGPQPLVNIVVGKK